MLFLTLSFNIIGMLKRNSTIIFFFLFTINAVAQKTVTLPNGWSLSPAGRSLPLGDLPLNIAVSPSKKWIAVTNNGQSKQSLQLINARTEKILDNIEN
jgi:hypothetical protein